MPNVFEALSYVNPSGKTVLISDTSVTKYWELRGRSGFAAPDVELITQRYANGTTKVLKRFVSPRTVRINMVLVGDTTAERDQYFSEMIRGLIDISGGNEGKLYVTRSDGTVVYLNCTYSSGMNVVDEYRKFHRFTLEFYASDPYFYKDLPSLSFSVNGNGTNYIYGDIYTIINNGYEPIEPIIRISNSTLAGGNIITFGFDRVEKFKLYYPVLDSGQALIIDTRTYSKSIYIINADNSIIQASKYLAWSGAELDMQIPPGPNYHQAYYNITAAGSSNIGKIEMMMSNRYLSA